MGAGLAGLTCAKVLAAEGRDVLLLEASDSPGGRVISRRTADGYVLDRGFQVLLDSYPAARRHLDFGRLQGGCFRSGALLVGRGSPQAFENPLRRPAALAGLLSGRPLARGDLLRLAGLVLRGMRATGADETSGAILRSAGLSEEFMRRFAVPFFGGVLLDPELGTSARLLLGYLRFFALGRARLPAGGIGDIPRQLAGHLPENAVWYGCRVEGLVMKEGRVAGVRLEDGQTVGAGFVVLAMDEPSLCRLLECGPPRPALPTAVHYFSCPEAWYDGAWLCLPRREPASPVLHAAILTNVVPGLAPPGRHLWSVTVLPGHVLAGSASAVAAEVASWFGRDPSVLEPVDFVRVPYAVPVQAPGFPDRPAPWGALPRGVLVAGDAACGASIDAVMRSGEAAAKKVISLGGGR